MCLLHEVTHDVKLQQLVEEMLREVCVTQYRWNCGIPSLKMSGTVAPCWYDRLLLQQLLSNIRKYGKQLCPAQAI